MSNKYRVVDVYTGYAENSIEHVETLEIHGDITQAANVVQQNNHDWLREDADFNDDHIQEFFTGIQVVGHIAGVRNGEENTFIVIPETSVWYDRVLDDQDIYDNHQDAWNALIQGE